VATDFGIKLNELIIVLSHEG